MLNFLFKKKEKKKKENLQIVKSTFVILKQHIDIIIEKQDEIIEISKKTDVLFKYLQRDVTEITELYLRLNNSNCSCNENDITNIYKNCCCNDEHIYEVMR